MNTLNTKKYLVTVIVQYLILLFDVFVNSFAGFSRQNPINLLILYVYVMLFLPESVKHHLCFNVALITVFKDSRLVSCYDPHSSSS